jgi:hypothetical protein
VGHIDYLVLLPEFEDARFGAAQLVSNNKDPDIYICPRSSSAFLFFQTYIHLMYWLAKFTTVMGKILQSFTWCKPMVLLLNEHLFIQ